MTGILLSFLGYSVLAAGQIFQKKGMDLRRKGSGAALPVLIAANSVTISSTFIILAAVSWSPVSLVGAMAGSGLITAALAGSFFLGERITRRSLVSILLIMAGIFLLGLYREISVPLFRPWVLFVFSAGITFFFVSALFFHRDGAHTGSLLGALSGSWAGLVTLLQKAADLYDGPALIPDTFLHTIHYAAGALLIPDSFTSEAVRVLINPYVPVWIAVSTTSMILIHAAFHKGAASSVIPVYSALFILVPVTGGFTAFGDNLSFPQWAGIFLITIGSIFISLKKQ